MTWLGILEGAMGIKYFIRRAPSFFPKSRLAWNEAVRAAHEVSMLAPWLFSAEERFKLPTGDEHLFATALPFQGSTLIVAANSRNRPKTLSLNLTNFTQAPDQQAHLLLENRTIHLSGNILSEPIDAYGVRVYLVQEEGTRGIKQIAKNLFINPGFERCPSPGVPAGCYASSENQPNYDGSTYFIDSRIAHSGYNSLRFHTVSDSSHLSLTFNKMQVEKNRLYYCSFWTRHHQNASAKPFTVRLPELNIEKEFQTSAGWQKHDFYFRTDERTAGVKWAISTRGKSTFWLDEVSVLAEPSVQIEMEEGPQAIVHLQTANPETPLFYQTIKQSPYMAYESPFRLDSYTDLNIEVRQLNTEPFGMSVTIPLSKATLKTCHFTTPISPKYQAQGSSTVLDGQYGSLSFRDNKYLGFNGTDVEFTIDLGEVMPVKSAAAHFLVSVDDGIHAPQSMEVQIATRPDNFIPFAVADNTEGSRQGEPYHYSLDLSGKTAKARYLKFLVKSPIRIPPGYLFAGTDAWLFIDEVLVQ